MSYTAGEALVLAVLRTVAGFTSTNTAQSDWNMLNDGIDLAGIVVQDAATIVPQSPVTFENHWRTCIQVWQFYVDELTTTTALQVNVELVKNAFQAKRTLGDTTGSIVDSQVVSITPPAEQWAKGGDGPMWTSQNIIIEWIEVQQVTYA